MLALQRTKPAPSGRKGAIFNNSQFRPEQSTMQPVPIHYSNLQLVLQMTPEQAARAEAKRGDSDAPMPELVATRLRAANVHYDWVGKRWTWKRIAENVAEIDMTTRTSTSLPVEEEQRSSPFIRTHMPRRECFLDWLYASSNLPHLQPALLHEQIHRLA